MSFSNNNFLIPQINPHNWILSFLLIAIVISFLNELNLSSPYQNSNTNNININNPNITW